MEIRTPGSQIGQFRLFRDLNPDYIELIGACASNVRFNAGTMIFRQSESADHCYLIRHGKVSVEIGPPSLTIQTLGPGEILGWEWLFPPYVWHFDTRALEPTRAVALDGACLRGKCEQDAKLGYDLMKRFSAIMHERLHATRIQLLDIYGPKRT